MNKSPDTDIKHQSTDIYFAALPIDELLPYLNSKITDFYDFAFKYKFLDKWKRSYLAYYGMSQSGTDSSKLNQAGVNGEEYILKVNDFRSLLQGLLTMTTSQRPALEPKAMNTDSKSMNQTILARTVLDYYMAEKHLEETLKDAVEMSLFGGDSCLVLDWNATAGQIYSVGPNKQDPVTGEEIPNSGDPIYDGDLEFKAYHAIDCIRECWSENATRKWWIIREFENKYDLAAKYKDQADQIIAISDQSDFMKSYSNINYSAKTDSDYIPVFKFYHEPTEALPNGRLVKFIGLDISLSDGSLPYKNMPVYPMMPMSWFGTPFGYTVAYDLMGIQTNLDALNSIVATNQMNYGIQNILLPRGGEYNVFALAQGLNGIDYDPKIGEPKPLNLLQTPEEIIKNIERLEIKQQKLSGQNDASRGNVDRDMSGAALALLASQAVQFNGGLQQSYNFLLESVGTGVIEILQMYATTPRIASISGKSNRARVKEFMGQDLDGINRVGVEQVNPVSKTAAGRLSMAQDMLKGQLIATPQHYFEVLTTGTIDSLYEHEMSQILMIRSENEDLIDGKAPTAVVTDKHKLHIQEHSTVLDSPEARQDPKIIQAVVAHMQQHIDILNNPDPKVTTLLQLLGEQTLSHPPQPPPAPGGPPPNQPPGPPKPATGPPGPLMPQMANPTKPVMQTAQGVKHPGMPHLPQQAPAPVQQAYEQVQANATPQQ